MQTYRKNKIVSIEKVEANKQGFTIKYEDGEVIAKAWGKQTMEINKDFLKVNKK